jgi:hypothetical protein
MDYLAEDRINAELPRKALVTCAQVKNAVLSLMINPNDIGSRLTLIMFAKPDFAEKDDLISLAVLSRYARRIALTIMKYDRERGSLLYFLRKVFVRAEQDVYYRIREIIRAEELHYEYPVFEFAGSDDELAEDESELPPDDYFDDDDSFYYQDDGVDYSEISGFSIIIDIDLSADEYLNRLAYDKSFGGVIKTESIFRKKKDGSTTDVLSPAFKMSNEELIAVLINLKQEEERLKEVIELFKPQISALNPAVCTPLFESFYAEHYTTPTAKRQQNLRVMVFDKMVLGEYNLSELDKLYRDTYKEAPPIKPKEARYGNRAKRIIKAFLDWCSENSEKNPDVEYIVRHKTVFERE